MEEYKIGQVIKVDNPDHQKTLKALIERKQVAEIAFHYASASLKNATSKIWEAVNDIYPGSEKVEFSLNHEPLELIIIGEK